MQMSMMELLLFFYSFKFYYLQRIFGLFFKKNTILSEMCSKNIVRIFLATNISYCTEHIHAFNTSDSHTLYLPPPGSGWMSACTSTF